MKTIDVLQYEFKKIDKADNYAMLCFYEVNYKYINNLNIDNKDNQKFQLHLKSEYALSLVALNKYHKALKPLSESIQSFKDSYKNELNRLLEIKYYQHLLWN